MNNEFIKHMVDNAKRLASDKDSTNGPWVIKHDGKIVERCADQSTALQHLTKLQPHSIWEATRKDGWEVVDEGNTGIDGKKPEGNTGVAKKVNEGKVPDDKDPEATKIKKLTEEEKDEEFEEDSQPEIDQVKDPANPTPAEGEEEEQDTVTKEYVGKTEDTHFYMVSTPGQTDEAPADMQIVDQEGTQKYSAKEQNLDPADPANFIIQAIQELEINEITRSVLVKYILPMLEEDETEEEEKPEGMEDETGAEDEEAGDKNIEPTKFEKDNESKVNEAEDYDKVVASDGKTVVKAEEGAGLFTLEKASKICRGMKYAVIAPDVDGKWVVIVNSRTPPPWGDATESKVNEKSTAVEHLISKLKAKKNPSDDERKLLKFIKQMDKAKAKTDESKVNEVKIPQFATVVATNRGEVVEDFTAAIKNLFGGHVYDRSKPELTYAVVSKRPLSKSDLKTIDQEEDLKNNESKVNKDEYAIKGGEKYEVKVMSDKGKQVSSSYVLDDEELFDFAVAELRLTEDGEERLQDLIAKVHESKVNEAEVTDVESGDIGYRFLIEDYEVSVVDTLDRGKDADVNCKRIIDAIHSHTDELNSIELNPVDESKKVNENEPQMTKEEGEDYFRGELIKHLEKMGDSLTPEEKDLLVKAKKERTGPVPSEGKVPDDKDPEATKIKKLIETFVQMGDDRFEVELVDDGTLDTVIAINGQEYRFDQDFASMWRDEATGELSKDGLTELALDALSNMEEEEYDEVKAAGDERSDDQIEDEEAARVRDVKLDMRDDDLEDQRRERGTAEESKANEKKKLPDALKNHMFKKGGKDKKKDEECKEGVDEKTRCTKRKKRQVKHIEKGEKTAGQSAKKAKEIAYATVNKLKTEGKVNEDKTEDPKGMRGTDLLKDLLGLS